jgi:hypothetical protein
MQLAPTPTQPHDIKPTNASWDWRQSHTNQLNITPAQFIYKTLTTRIAKEPKLSDRVRTAALSRDIPQDKKNSGSAELQHIRL